jgi:hypothetical protein
MVYIVMQFVESQPRFGGTYRLNLQGRRISRATFFYFGFLLGFFIIHEGGSDIFLRNVG